jgi:ankyrin repeat protein
MHVRFWSATGDAVAAGIVHASEHPLPTELQSSVDAFIDAAATGELTREAIHAALQHGVPINARTLVGDWPTALHVAVAHAHEDVVLALLEAGANANVVNYQGSTPLLRGAFGSSAAILRALIAQGGNVNVVAHGGVSPIAAVLMSESGDARDRLHVLLSRPELDLELTYLGRTPLELATLYKRDEMFEDIQNEVRATAAARWHISKSQPPRA